MRPHLEKEITKILKICRVIAVFVCLRKIQGFLKIFFVKLNIAVALPFFNFNLILTWRSSLLQNKFNFYFYQPIYVRDNPTRFLRKILQKIYHTMSMQYVFKNVKMTLTFGILLQTFQIWVYDIFICIDWYIFWIFIHFWKYIKLLD